MEIILTIDSKEIFYIENDFDKKHFGCEYTLPYPFIWIKNENLAIPGKYFNINYGFWS